VDDYNETKLTEICHPNVPPLSLNGLDFEELFKWLSATMVAVSASAQNGTIQLPTVSGWTQTTV
jgi:uncharacterized protein YegL